MQAFFTLWKRKDFDRNSIIFRDRVETCGQCGSPHELHIDAAVSAPIYAILNHDKLHYKEVIFDGAFLDKDREIAFQYFLCQHYPFGKYLPK